MTRPKLFFKHVEILAALNSRGVERWATPAAVAYLKSGK
ncbi:MAG: hypothetical protein RL514_1944 [Verrucomicrobiota bacterium]|jgi:hypothetical protein